MAESERGRKSPEALVDELRAIIAANLETNVELLWRLKGLVATAGQAAAATPGHMPDAATLLTHGVESTLAFSAIVNQHMGAMLNELMTAAEQSLNVAPPSAQASAAPSEPATPLRFEGRRGQRPVREFAVDNEYESPVQVSFAVSALTPDTGPALSASHVVLDPVHLTIGPRSFLMVKAAVDITEDFVAGQTYSGTIRVVGFQAPDIAVQVVVLGPAQRTEGAAVGARGPKRAGTRTRKRR